MTKPGALSYVDVACPLCKGDAHDVLYERNRRSNTKGDIVTVRVVQCRACGFVYNSPLPSRQWLEEHYRNGLFASGRVFREEGCGGYYPRLFAERSAFLARFLESRPPGRLLDIGCGVGSFLHALADNEALAGWALSGLEPSTTACRAVEKRGFSVVQGMLGDTDEALRGFDVATLISVLEHLPDAVGALESVRGYLKNDGLVFLEVPNVLEPTIDLSGYFSIEHIVHFSPGSMAGLLRQAGWRYVHVDTGHRGCIRAIASNSEAAMAAFPPSDPPSDDRALVAETVCRFAVEERSWLDSVLPAVKATLDGWRAEGRRIAIYGAGLHTLALAGHLDLAPYGAVLLDGDDKKQGNPFLEMPVRAPEDIGALGIDAVLISSHRFRDEMVETVRRNGGEDIAVADLYGAGKDQT